MRRHSNAALVCTPNDAALRVRVRPFGRARLVARAHRIAPLRYSSRHLASRKRLTTGVGAFRAGRLSRQPRTTHSIRGFAPPDPNAVACGFDNLQPRTLNSQRARHEAVTIIQAAAWAAVI